MEQTSNHYDQDCIEEKEEEIGSKSVNRILVTMKNVRMMLTSIKNANGDEIMTTKMINYDNKTILKNELLNDTAKRIQ